VKTMRFSCVRMIESRPDFPSSHQGSELPACYTPRLITEAPTRPPEGVRESSKCKVAHPETPAQNLPHKFTHSMSLSGFLSRARALSLLRSLSQLCSSLKRVHDYHFHDCTVIQVSTFRQDHAGGQMEPRLAGV